MDLMPEEKQRIYEEEKVKAEAQERAKKEIQAKNTKKGCLGCLGFIVLIIIAGILLNINKSIDRPTLTGSETTTESTKPNLELLNYTDKAEEYSHFITGTVRNNTSKEYGYVQITFNLYDRSGSQVGTAMDNINSLEPGGTWKFKAIILDDNAKRYKLKSLNGF